MIRIGRILSWGVIITGRDFFPFFMKYLFLMTVGNRVQDLDKTQVQTGSGIAIPLFLGSLTAKGKK